MEWSFLGAVAYGVMLNFQVTISLATTVDITLKAVKFIKVNNSVSSTTISGLFTEQKVDS